MVIDFFLHNILGTAILACFIASLVSSLIGPLIIYNRLNYFSSTFTHASIGGIGIGVFFSLPLLLSAQIFAVLLGLLAALYYYLDKERFSSYLDIFYAFGMSLGLLLINLAPVYQKDFSSYLFGSILLITNQDLLQALIVGFACCLFIVLDYKRLLLISLDFEFAKLRGVKVKIHLLLLIIFLALCLPMLIRLIGITASIILLAAGPLILDKFLNSLSLIMIYSFLLNLSICGLGLLLAMRLDAPLGAVITQVAVVFIIVGSFASFVYQRRLRLKNYIR